MPDPLQALLASAVLPTTSFPPTSRYSGIVVDDYDPGDGSPSIAFLHRRFCPRPERFAELYELSIVEGDRRDLLAARHIGDSELWWQLADANGVLDPRALTDTAGRRLRITGPEGMPGGVRV